jgi:hypothetical protein
LTRLAAPTLLLALTLLACRDTPKPAPRTEPWLASAVPSASAAAVVRRLRYTLEKSRVELELPAKRATPRGRFKSARGTLDVDLDDLSRTTGSVSVSLEDIELLGEDGMPHRTYTERAHEWLELGAKVAAEKRETGRAVTFSLTALDAGRVVAAPGGRGRTARNELVSSWSVRGDLGLHGVRAPVSAEIGLTLVPGADAEGPPAELVIRSRRPLVVKLGTHDIRPRDEHGVPITRDLALLGEKVGSAARVTYELVFVPAR